MKSNREQGRLTLGSAAIRALVTLTAGLMICMSSCGSDTESQFTDEQRDSVAEETARPVTEAIQDLEAYKEVDYQELIRKYPLGWVSFVVHPNQKKIISKDETHLSADFGIDWSKAEVLDTQPMRAIFVLPEILYYKSGQEYKGSGTVNIPRKVGASLRLRLNLEGVDARLQLLADDGEELLIVIGFSEEKPQDE